MRRYISRDLVRNPEKEIAVNIRIILIVGLFSLHSSAFAYKPDLHKVFTENAVTQSTFFYENIAGWGDNFNSNDYLYLTPKIEFSQIEDKSDFKKVPGNYVQVIKGGALWEDEAQPSIWNGKRPFNHFFDPQNQNRPATVDIPMWWNTTTLPFTRGFGVIPPGADVFLLKGPAIGNNSPDWILEDKKDAERFVGGIMNFDDQEFSYYDARNYMYEGLTLRFPGAREEAAQLMYQSLGQILHHIQDMGQPQHVRNDQHCDACPIINDLSLYEVLTGSKLRIGQLTTRSDLAYLLKRSTYRQEPVIFKHPREYWVNGERSGMAEFTSNNFVTTESNYGLSGSGIGHSGKFSEIPKRLEANSEYPAPSTIGLTYKSMTVGEAIQNSIYGFNLSSRMNGTQIGFLGRDIYDRLTKTFKNHERMATYSILAHDLDKVDFFSQQVLTVNQFNHEDRLPILFPRIVAFSSGMLDYFARVKVKLIPVDDGGVLEIQNLTTSESSISGEFKIYSEDTMGTRVLVKTISATLAYGEKIKVTATSDTLIDSIGLVLAFKGQAGKEGNGDDRLFAVGGHYIKYEYVHVRPCAEDIHHSGKDDFIKQYDMGERPGVIKLSYDAHASGDRFGIKYNGKWYGTGSKDPGAHELEFYYDPAANGGNTTVELHIGADDEYSTWHYTLACPVEQEQEPEPEPDPDQCIQARSNTYSSITDTNDKGPLPDILFHGNEEVGTEIVQSRDVAIEYVTNNRSLNYQMYTENSEAAAGCISEKDSKSSAFWNMVCLNIVTGNYRGYRLWYQIHGQIDGGNRSPSATLHLVPNEILTGGTYDGQGAAADDCKSYVEQYVSQGISNLKDDCDNPIRDVDGRWYVRNYYVNMSGESYCEHRYYWGDICT